MKTFLPSTLLRIATVVTFCLLLQVLSYTAQAQTPTVRYNAGRLCVGSDVYFSFSGGTGCYVNSWSVSGSNYTIVSQSSTAITVRWNSAQTAAGVTAYYTGCYDGGSGYAYSSTYAVSSAVTPTVSMSPVNTTVSPGQTIAFQAAGSNTGTSPSYYWYLNGTSVSGSGSSYSFNQAAAGTYTVMCRMYSSEPCASTYADASTTVTVSNPLIAPLAYANVMMATLPNSSITASSCWGGCVGGGHESWRGRLFDQSGTANWSAAVNDLNQYLQVDLGEVRLVEGVVTQGRHTESSSQWVTSYTLSYSQDNITWTNYSQAFTGNTDRQTPVANTVTTPFAARYVRIKPTGWNEHISMRAEIVSVPFGRSSITFVAALPTGANSSKWYTTATGGTPVHIGTSFIPALPADKTYYVSSYNTTSGVESGTRTAVTGNVRLLSSTMNHVVSSTVNVKGVITAQQVYTVAVGSNRQQEAAYLDQLGRPVQQVVTKGSFASKDLVTFKAYDPVNREAKQYLTYAAVGTDGKYKTDAPTAQPSFYQTAKADNMAFAESRFENSPAGRVVEQGAPGIPWQPASTPETGKTQKFAYGKNSASEIRMWNYDMATKAATGTAFYPANALYVTQSTDEHGMKSLEYKDKGGKVVCSKVQKVLNDENSYLFSYNVYDNFGNLRFVVPPEAVIQLAAVNYTFAYNDAFCQRWLFAYQYDVRWRPTEKSVPGGGITFMVYDPLDRVVLTQDAAAYAGRRWKFVKYDALGREIMAGRYTHGTQVTQAVMQQVVDDFYATNTARKYYEGRSNATFASFHGYTNQAFPVIPSPNNDNGQPDMVSYYDDYDYDYNGVEGETAKGEPAYVSFGGSFPATAGRTRGKSTGTRIRVLVTTPTWLLSAVFYDADGQVVQSQIENYNTAGIVPAAKGRNLEVVATQYDFAGKVLQTERRHCLVVADNTFNLSQKQRYVYDHVGRVKEEYVRINNETEQKLAVNTYSEIGELSRKVVGNGTGLQTMDYKYNIRGWLKTINDGVLDSGTDVFAMSFVHQEGSVGPQYNGNISKFDWISKTDNVRRAYQFSYDGLNRLLAGDYSSTVALEQFSVNNLTYDNNGNLQTMHRQNLLSRTSNATDQFGYVDKLQYAYNGNRLSGVDDELHATATQAKDFPDKSRIATNPIEYSYDGAGSLTADKNKGITSIVYNELGLPAIIYLGTSNYLTNVYDATGAKLQTTITKGGSVISTQKYIGGIVYRNDVPQFISTSAGRVLSPQASGAAAWVYEYHYRDHLGSLRVAMRQPQNVQYIAGMELEADPAWSNVSTPVRNSERASSGLYSAKLTTSSPLGPWKTVKVSKGDVITVLARGSYLQAPTNNAAVSLIPYVNSLPAQSTESGNSPSRLSFGLTVVPQAVNSVQSTVPKAHLSYLLQTADGTVIHSKRQYLTTLASNAWEGMSMSYTAESEGYLQVLVANESDKPVWFDEVTLSVQPGLIVQETHYDPWGLELAGIEGRGSPEHQYKFQDKELIDELDLYLMDFHARYYDAQLGRWHAVDPADQFGSPYLAMGNNPVIGVDPDGKIVPLVIGAAALIGGAFNVVTNLQNIKSAKQGVGFFLVGAVAGGVAAATGGAALAAGGGATVLGAVVGSGMTGGIASGGILGTGNALLGGQTFGGAVEAGLQGAVSGALTGAVTGGVSFGIAKGVQALKPLFSRAFGSGDLALTRALNDGSGRSVKDVLESGVDAAKGGGSEIKLFNSLTEKFGEGYRSVSVAKGSYLDLNYGQNLNAVSKGSWTKIFEAGYLNSSKVEVHYFYNSTTSQYANPFIKMGEWGSKAFKTLK